MTRICFLVEGNAEPGHPLADLTSDFSGVLADASGEDKAIEAAKRRRKRTGFAVLIYLLLFAVITWFSYRRIWRDVAH